MEMAMAIEQNGAKVQEMLQKMEADPITSRIMEAAETVEDMYEAAKRYISIKLDEFKELFDEALGYYDKKTKLSDEDMEMIVGGSWSDIWNKCKKVALAAVVVVGVVALSAATAGVAAGVIGAAAGAAGAVAAAAVGGTTTAAVAAASVGTASFVTGAVAGAGLSIKTLIEKS